jgi:hypothetical protein
VACRIRRVRNWVRLSWRDRWYPSEQVEARRHGEHEDARRVGAREPVRSSPALLDAPDRPFGDGHRIDPTLSVRLRVLCASVLQLTPADHAAPPEEPHPPEFRISLHGPGPARPRRCTTRSDDLSIPPEVLSGMDWPGSPGCRVTVQWRDDAPSRGCRAVVTGIRPSRGTPRFCPGCRACCRGAHEWAERG